MRYYLDGVGQVFRVIRVDDQGLHRYELLEGTEWIGGEGFKMSNEAFEKYEYRELSNFNTLTRVLELSKSEVIKMKLRGEL